MKIHDDLPEFDIVVTETVQTDDLAITEVQFVSFEGDPDEEASPGIVLARGCGEARRNTRGPDRDKPDWRVGMLLAYGRALESLGRKLQRQGNGLVKHHDDMKLQRALAEAQERLHAAGDADDLVRQIMAEDVADTKKKSKTSKTSKENPDG